MKIIIKCFSELQLYTPIWHTMRDFTLTRNETSIDTLLILEHYPVFTLGQAGTMEHVLRTTEIPIIQCDRGGQVTYHGPGQLILYPLFDLGRLHLTVNDFVRALEELISDTLHQYDIAAHRKDGAPGVYVNDAKIASIGLRCRHQRCYHGISINFDLDLTPFSYINPCGYQGMLVTKIIDHNKSLTKEQFLSTLLDNLVKKLHYTKIETTIVTASNVTSPILEQNYAN